MKKCIIMLVAAGAASIATADINDLRVTEIFAGQAGPDGTSDWFELTNYGNAAVSTAGLYYDDNSFSPTVNDALDALTLAPGESAVFLASWDDDFDSAAEAISTFVAFWGLSGSGVQVGTVTGGAGLGGGGDAVSIFDSNLASANLITSGAYSDGEQRGTIDYAQVDPTKAFRTVADESFSSLSMPWVFESVGTAGNNNQTLFGSPGAVPTPAAAGLLGFAGLLGARRRR
jgi:hypothetical protein